MKSLSIRNLPDEIYERLKTMARQNHRSLQEQVRFLLEQDTRLAHGGVLEQARKWRRRLAGREFSDVVTMIRSDRER